MNGDLQHLRTQGNGHNIGREPNANRQLSQETENDYADEYLMHPHGNLQAVLEPNKQDAHVDGEAAGANPGPTSQQPPTFANTQGSWLKRVDSKAIALHRPIDILQQLKTQSNFFGDSPYNILESDQLHRDQSAASASKRQSARHTQSSSKPMKRSTNSLVNRDIQKILNIT